MVKHDQIRNKRKPDIPDEIILIEFFTPDTLAPALLASLPESQQFIELHVIAFISFREIDQKKSDAALLFHQTHEFHLMSMDILQRESLLGAFLSIETYRDPLYGADIINGALLIEIGERDMAGLLVKLNQGGGRRYLLDQRHSVLCLIISSNHHPRRPLVFHVAI